MPTVSERQAWEKKIFVHKLYIFGLVLKQVFTEKKFDVMGLREYFCLPV